MARRNLTVKSKTRLVAIIPPGAGQVGAWERGLEAPVRGLLRLAIHMDNLSIDK